MAEGAAGRLLEVGLEATADGLAMGGACRDTLAAVALFSIGVAERVDVVERRFISFVGGTAPSATSLRRLLMAPAVRPSRDPIAACDSPSEERRSISA